MLLTYSFTQKDRTMKNYLILGIAMVILISCKETQEISDQTEIEIPEETSNLADQLEAAKLQRLTAPKFPDGITNHREFMQTHHEDIFQVKMDVWQIMQDNQGAQWDEIYAKLEEKIKETEGTPYHFFVDQLFALQTISHITKLEVELSDQNKEILAVNTQTLLDYNYDRAAPIAASLEALQGHWEPSKIQDAALVTLQHARTFEADREKANQNTARRFSNESLQKQIDQVQNQGFTSQDDGIQRLQKLTGQ
jgi:hypothetical protein